MRGMQFVYLELACYGLSYPEIAKRYGVRPRTVADQVLVAARIVGRMGFWKFHVTNRDELGVLSQQILAKMDKHGLRGQMKEAA